MTKTKNKPKKVTKEELSEIQKIVFKIEQLHMTIGQLESKKHANLHILAGVNDEMNIMQEKLRSCLLYTSDAADE